MTLAQFPKFDFFGFRLFFFKYNTYAVTGFYFFKIHGKGLKTVKFLALDRMFSADDCIFLADGR